MASFHRRGSLRDERVQVRTGCGWSDAFWVLVLEIETEVMAMLESQEETQWPAIQANDRRRADEARRWEVMWGKADLTDSEVEATGTAKVSVMFQANRRCRVNDSRCWKVMWGTADMARAAAVYLWAGGGSDTSKARGKVLFARVRISARVPSV